MTSPTFRFKMGPNLTRDKWDASGERPRRSVQKPICKVPNNFRQYLQFTTKNWIEIRRHRTTKNWGEWSDNILIRPEMQELRRECWSNVRRDEMSAQKEKWEIVISGRQMDSVRNEISVVLTTGLVLVKEHSHSLLLRRHRLRLKEECLAYVALLEERFLRDRKTEIRVKTFWKESARNLHMI